MTNPMVSLIAKHGEPTVYLTGDGNAHHTFNNNQPSQSQVNDWFAMKSGDIEYLGSSITLTTDKPFQSWRPLTAMCIRQ